MQTFLLPDLGEGLTEAELVNWLVAEGDDILVDQPVAEVETAKAVVEVPSPYAGRVARLHGSAGDKLLVGRPLLSVEPSTPAAEPSQPAVEPPIPAVKPPTPEMARSVPAPGSDGSGRPVSAAGSGQVLIGYGTPAARGARRTLRPRSRTAAPARTAGMDGQAEKPGRSGTAAPLVSSPLVRGLARKHGLAVAGIQGSGPDGLILRRDVEAVISQHEHTGPAAAAAAAGPAAAEAAGPGAADARTGLQVAFRTPLRGARRSAAEAMARSRREIPEATVWVDVDATALVRLREAMHAKVPGSAPGLLAFIGRFAVAGLRKYPELNSRLEGDELVGFDGVNLGFAAQTDRGLLVPSVRHADRLNARELDAEIRRLTDVVRTGRAAPGDLAGGTFTVNNYGVFGVDGSAAIINYPEAAILGVGRILERPWAVNGALAVRSVVELTLAFDHRVCDGGTAAGFLRYVADAIENPAAVLADL